MPLPSDQDASGRDLGTEELELLQQVIESGTLTSTKGTFVKQLEQEFAETCTFKKGNRTMDGYRPIPLADQADQTRPNTLVG